MSDDDNKGTIVLVDDEEMVLSSISSFLNLEANYNVKSFLSPHEALNFIQANETNLIISDYLMPEMDGITFLAKAREMRPQATRIILTGYADKENAIKAINDVGLFQYIEKPWDNEEILIVIRNGLERESLMRKLDDKVRQINKAYDELQNLHREIVKTFA